MYLTLIGHHSAGRLLNFTFDRLLVTSEHSSNMQSASYLIRSGEVASHLLVYKSKSGHTRWYGSTELRVPSQCLLTITQASACRCNFCDSSCMPQCKKISYLFNIFWTQPYGVKSANMPLSTTSHGQSDRLFAPKHRLTLDRYRYFLRLLCYVWHRIPHRKVFSQVRQCCTCHEQRSRTLSKFQPRNTLRDKDSRIHVERMRCLCTKPYPSIELICSSDVAPFDAARTLSLIETTSTDRIFETCRHEKQ